AATWASAAHAFLARVRAAFPAPRLVVYNGIAVPPGKSGLPSLSFLETADGVCYEAFSIAIPMDRDERSKSFYFTHGIRQAMAEAKRRDKLFLIQATGDARDEQTRTYALACFLLLKWERSFFYFA